MQRLVLVGVVGLLAVACGGKPPTTTSKCGTSDCSETQRCDAATLLCVQDTPPEVTLDAVAATSTGTTLAVEGTATDDVGVARLEYSTDGDATWTPVEGRSAETGRFSVSLALPTADSSAFKVTVRVADTLNQEATASVTTTVDNVGPSVTLTRPTATVRGADVLMEVIGADGSGEVTAATFRRGAVAVTATRNGSHFEGTVALPQAADFGPLSFVVTATDKHGNTGETTVSFNADTLAPTGAFTSPDAGALVGGSSLNVRLTGQDLGGVASVRVQGPGPDAGFIEASTGDDGGTWTASVSLPTADSVAHTLGAELTDTVGNSSQATVTFLVDNVAPVVAFVEPAADALLGGPSTSTVRVAVQAPGAAAVTLAIGGGSPVTATHEGSDVWAAILPLPASDYAPVSLSASATDAAQNAGTAQRQIFVDRVAPTLTITSPTEGQRLNAANFSNNDAAVMWAIVDADPQAMGESSRDGITWTPGTFLSVTTSPTDNPTTYSAQARGRDRAGNVGPAVTRTFSVDRVAPTVLSLLPANNARNVEPRTATVMFSEPVQGPTLTSEGLTVSPAPPAGPVGAWTGSHDGYTTPPLAGYAVYTASIPANITDQYGNPLVSSPTTRFHTVAATPASGATLATNVDTAEFNAAADSDGVALVGYRVMSPASYTAATLSPSTGTLAAPVYTVGTPGTLFRAQLGAYRAVNADLTSERVEGLAVYLPPVPPALFGLRFASWRSGTGALQSRTADGFLATPAIPSGDVDGTGQVGFFSTANYLRDPAVSVPLGGTPQYVVAASARRWAAFRQSGTTLSFDDYECVFMFVSSCTTNAASVTTTGNDIAATVSAAMSPNASCLAVTFDGAAGRQLAVRPRVVCDRFGCNPGPVVQATVNPGLRVAPFVANNEDTIIGAWSTVGGVQLGKMTGCSSTFTNVGLPLATTPAAFRPLQLGNKPALLYIDSTNALKVFIP